MLAAGLAGLAVAGVARAEAPFPSRPLIIMAPANPGGGTDQIARLMRIVLTEEGLSPKPIQVINRGGAAGAIGLAELISRHHGDPYMVMASGGGVVATTLSQGSPFRASDADPLARLTVDDMIVAVPKDSPFKTIDEFISTFRRDPNSVTWCGGSAGGVDHILVGLIAEACGVRASDLRYIAYAGGGAASAAILGGQVSAGATGYSEWRGLVEEGRIRILASASLQRFGDGRIPTLKEAGVDVVLQNWRGVFAPPGLKPGPRAWWVSAIERMRASDMWQNFLAENGWQDGYLPQEEFRRTIKEDEARYSKILARLVMGESSSSSSHLGPYAFPAIIGAAGALAIGATVIEQVRAKGQTVVPAGAEDDDEGGGPLPVWRRFLGGAGLVLAYLGALKIVGFLFATPCLHSGAVPPYAFEEAGSRCDRRRCADGGRLAAVHAAALRGTSLKELGP